MDRDFGSCSVCFSSASNLVSSIMDPFLLTTQIRRSGGKLTERSCAWAKSPRGIHLTGLHQTMSGYLVIGLVGGFKCQAPGSNQLLFPGRVIRPTAGQRIALASGSQLRAEISGHAPISPANGPVGSANLPLRGPLPGQHYPFDRTQRAGSVAARLRPVLWPSYRCRHGAP